MSKSDLLFVPPDFHKPPQVDYVRLSPLRREIIEKEALIYQGAIEIEGIQIKVSYKYWSGHRLDKVSQ